MKLLVDLVILIAKLLIFIGDLVLLVFKPFSQVFKLAKSLPKLEFQRVKETEIFNSEDVKTTPVKKSRKLKTNFDFSLLQSKIPATSLLRKTPPITLPKFKFPKIEKKNFSLPKLNFHKPALPRIPRFDFQIQPLFKVPAKHRGRKRKISAFIPFGTKFKYLAAGAFFSFIFVFLPITTILFLQDLPNPSELSRQDIAQTTKIYDRNGTLLYSIYADQNRTSVPLSQIPDNLKKATIAIEDKNFYSNPGIDVLAIVRSAVANIQNKPTQGGSTITQQLVKARLLSPERSFDRKIKEIALSVWAQRIYSKNQILEMYLNQVPYGGTSWGAEAASQTYFGKDVKDLDLAQAAFLAGLPQAPTVYSPYSGEPTAWVARQHEVLDRMQDLGFITSTQKIKAEKEKLTFQPYRHILHAPHFVMYVQNLLVQKYGQALVERGGLSVVTSLDLNTQDMAQRIVTSEVDKAGYLNFTNGAALITNPKNGDVLAMVGGKDYYDPNGGNYNVTTALRQPGSTIKAVTYSAALMNGFTAATPIQDTPVTFNIPGSAPYSPVNYDGRFHGTVTLRTALANSINVPAVKTLNQIGVPTMVNLAKNMGITSWGDPGQYGLAVTLGAAEVRMTDLATVYGTLANQGERVDLNPILKVTDYQGNVLEEKKDIAERQVLPKNVPYIISNILADNSARQMEFGPNSPLNIPGHTVSVKTGTTDNKRDNWTIGYTPNLLTAVWVGNNNNQPMNPILASGITGAAPIWHDIMTNLISKESPSQEQFAMPSDVVTEICNGHEEVFVKGTERGVNCHPLSINNQIPKDFRH